MSTVKNWPTWKISEVLADPYCRGINGADYEDIKEELEHELYSRENKAMEKKLNSVENIPQIEGNIFIQRLEDEIELEALNIYSDQLKEQAEAMALERDIFSSLDDLIGIRGKFELCNEMILKREL